VTVKTGVIDGRAGFVLRRARLRAALTQSQVAERAGLPQSTVSAYESGRRQPTLPMLSKLLEAMGAELTLGAVDLPERLGPLTGPVGLRLRRCRAAIVEEADRHGLVNVRVLGAAARGEEQPGDRVELLVDQTPQAMITSLIGLAAVLEEFFDLSVHIVTTGQLEAEREAVAL